MIEVGFATERVAEKVMDRGLTLEDCVEVLENSPHELRSGTDRFGQPKYVAYGETSGGVFALVVYVYDAPSSIRIISARRKLTKREEQVIRTRRGR